MEEIKLPDNATFNHAAARENEHNKKCVRLSSAFGVTALNVDSKKATYRGIPVSLLSDEQKKKFENIILFLFLAQLKEMPVITYV